MSAKDGAMMQKGLVCRRRAYDIRHIWNGGQSCGTKWFSKYSMKFIVNGEKMGEKRELTYTYYHASSLYKVVL